MTKLRIPAYVLLFLALALSHTAQAQDACDNNVCCANANACEVIDKESLEQITIDAVVDVGDCAIRLGEYVSGGDGYTGVAPENYPANLCGLSFSLTNDSPAAAINSLDHKWLQSFTTPIVVDFSTPVSSVFVFAAVDHGPFPEEGIEQTVWGRNGSADTTDFPQGWTKATLTKIWKKGWEDPVACQGQDNTDDFTGEYSFPGGASFQYVATYANLSISIFDTPAHETWADVEDESEVAGWQSDDHEIDAIGTIVCPVCGNEVVESGEQCDDGNTVSGDGCSATCQTERCGDGKVDVGEECDDGNNADEDGCSAQCTIEEPPGPVCGNGVVETGEECDDGNTVGGDGCSATCETEENNPPDCSQAIGGVILWPPNHKFVDISITGVTDPDGDTVKITATSVFQDELVKETGTGSGNTSPDANLSPLQVRAERNGNPKTPGNGRVYHINFTADDGRGGSCAGEVLVCVPHDQGGRPACIDEGPLYNSLLP
ncbi:MAG: DUF4215 domain-containing protein [Candidatus Binatia bacterium]